MNEYKEMKFKKDGSEYEQQAQNFLKKTGSKISIKNTGLKVPNWGKERVNSYSIFLENERNGYFFDFYDSINATQKGEKPTIYGILVCIGVDYSEDFEDFCINYGYATDSIKALETYKEVCRHNEELEAMYTDEELELLSEVA